MIQAHEYLSVTFSEPLLVFSLVEKPELKFEMSMENAQASGLVTTKSVRPGSAIKTASVNEIKGLVKVDAKNSEDFLE